MNGACSSPGVFWSMPLYKNPLDPSPKIGGFVSIVACSRMSVEYGIHKAHKTNIETLESFADREAMRGREILAKSSDFYANFCHASSLSIFHEIVKFSNLRLKY